MISSDVVEAINCTPDWPTFASVENPGALDAKAEALLEAGANANPEQLDDIRNRADKVNLVIFMLLIYLRKYVDDRVRYFEKSLYSTLTTSDC